MERERELLNIGIENLELALKEIKGEKYIYIHKIKHSEYKCEKSVNNQKIVILFSKLLDNDITIESRVFIDNELYRNPIMLKVIKKDAKYVIIDDFNCDKYINRGLGTCIIESLCEILKELGIEELHAPLRTLDYCKKDMLYKFYININGFKLGKELTEYSDGLVIKKIL